MVRITCTLYDAGLFPCYVCVEGLGRGRKEVRFRLPENNITLYLWIENHKSHKLCPFTLTKCFLFSFSVFTLVYKIDTLFSIYFLFSKICTEHRKQSDSFVNKSKNKSKWALNF